MTGSLVSAGTRQRVRDLATPIATGLGRLGLTPNALTLIGFAGTAVAAWAAANQWWLAAGVLVLAFGIFDLFDGALARATGRTSKLGAFLDSTFDRAGELLVYIGLAAGLMATGPRLAVTLTLLVWAAAASTMVSYTRAKSESLGFTTGTGMAAVGLAPREVRVAVMGIGLILAGLLPTPDIDFFAIREVPPPIAAITGVLGIIAILATITTVQRILHVRAQAREG
ncbi:MAG TPA: CDP-alcohol phosphatidyltransferase family protein [Candidatus Limnocylindrales bacterium]